MPRLIAAARRLEVVTHAVRLPGIRSVYGDLGVRDRTGRPLGTLRHGPSDRAGRRRIDGSQVRREIELVFSVVLVPETPADVEIEHDVGALSRDAHGILHERVDRRPPVPVHLRRGLGRIVPRDQGLGRVDRHPDGVILAGGHFALAQEGRGPLLQGEQVKALPGLRNKHPLAVHARVLRRVCLDPHHVDVDAVERVIRERSVGEPHRNPRPQDRWGVRRGVVLIARGQGERERQASGECGTFRH